MGKGKGLDTNVKSLMVVTFAVIAVVLASFIAGGCSDDDSDFHLTWVNTHGVDVVVQVEGVAVTWCGDANPDTATLPAGATRKSCESYPAGHYEYMVHEKGTGKPLICEGRFDLDADHTTLETKPVPGGSTSISTSGDC